MRRRSILTLLATLPVSAACGESSTPREPARVPGEPAANPQGASPRYATTLIPDVPHIRQKPDFCGEAIVAAYLAKLGKSYDQDDVFALSGMDPSRGMGATTRELKVALERIGFEPGAVWHHVSAENAPTELEALFENMHADLVAGVPSIICTRYADRARTTEHFRLVLGYDANSDEVIYHEPAETDGAYRRMKRQLMLELWPLKYAADRWTVIRMRLAPNSTAPNSTASGRPSMRLADPPHFAGHAPADYAQHVLALNKRLPKGFTVQVQEPFVVVGDDTPALVRKRAAGTVRWAVDKLKAAYFASDPKDIIDVYLFKDNRSYRKHAWDFWGDKPDTPYGYFSDDDHAMVMNISTGGGTLVHEIVHPFIDANFPDCPAWFNEGLGSLYEQSAERNGNIVGLTNWRLAGLQEAIRRRVVPSFQTLTHTSTRAFYEHDPGTNYAQSRYLLYYLQEQSLLRRYYHAFNKGRVSDPTGYDTLAAVLGLPPTSTAMGAFQNAWQQYVMSLRFA